VLVENFAPGALDRMGLTWEHIHKLNPRMIVASVKASAPARTRLQGLRERSRNAPAARPRPPASARPPLVTGAQIGDSGTGLHLGWALWRRSISAFARDVDRRCSARCKWSAEFGARKTARSAAPRAWSAEEYSQYGEGVPFGKAVPRAGNDSGGGQPGWILKCKGWENDPTPTSISSPRRRCGARSAT